MLSTAQDGAASDSESGNIVLRSAVDDTEEATNMDASALGEEILEYCNAKLDSLSEVRERTAVVSESDDIKLCADDEDIEESPDESDLALGEDSTLK